MIPSVIRGQVITVLCTHGSQPGRSMGLLDLAKKVLEIFYNNDNSQSNRLFGAIVVSEEPGSYTIADANDPNAPVRLAPAINCATVTGVAAAAAALVPAAAPGDGVAFSIPRTIREQMRTALTPDPLMPGELADAVITSLVLDRGQPLPNDPDEQARIKREILNKIASTIDGKEFQFVRTGDNQNKIRVVPITRT